MQDLERKTFYVSSANKEEATEKIETHRVFGWVEESRNYDEKRQVERVVLTRDLSLEDNQAYKTLQDDYDDAEKAQIYCDLNIKDCHRKIKECSRHTLPIVGLLFLGLLIAALVAFAGVLKFSDDLISGVSITFTLNGENIPLTKDFVYVLPESGDTMSDLFRSLGIQTLTYDSVVNVLCIILLAIAAFILGLAMILVVNAHFRKKILRAQKKHEELRLKQFETLRLGLMEWDAEKVADGTFDAYRYVTL